MAGASLKVVERVNAPVARVFAVFSDLHGAAENVAGIESLEVLTDGPIGLGTRWRETRIMFKKEATEEMEITEWDPPRGYSVTAQSHGCLYLSTFTFLADGDSTTVQMTFEGTPLTFMAKVMMVFARFMMGMMRKCMAKDLADLKAAAEGDGPIGGEAFAAG